MIYNHDYIKNKYDEFQRNLAKRHGTKKEVIQYIRGILAREDPKFTKETLILHLKKGIKNRQAIVNYKNHHKNPLKYNIVQDKIYHTQKALNLRLLILQFLENAPDEVMNDILQPETIRFEKQKVTEITDSYKVLGKYRLEGT